MLKDANTQIMAYFDLTVDIVWKWQNYTNDFW